MTVLVNSADSPHGDNFRFFAAKEYKIIDTKLTIYDIIDLILKKRRACADCVSPVAVYAERLAEMIKCKTVSRKDCFEASEFMKLRQVIETLFPLVTKSAKLKILGDDAYLYKLRGADESRSVILMSHHDVVAARTTSITARPRWIAPAIGTSKRPFRRASPMPRQSPLFSRQVRMRGSLPVYRMRCSALPRSISTSSSMPRCITTTRI